MRLALASACLLACVALAAAASTPLSVLPAAAQVMATHCLAENGEDGCKWPCKEVPDCQLCQNDGSERNPEWTCLYCKPGFFKSDLYADEDDWDSQCVACPQGAWCAGTKKHDCDEGVTTATTKRWDPSQCDQALPGYGAPGTPCSAGTFQPIISSAGTCSYCPDGLYANINKGATECVGPITIPPTDCPKNSKQNKNIKACECDAGFCYEPTDQKSLNKKEDQPPIYPAPTCTACLGNTASSLNNPAAKGATGKCVECPEGSRAVSLLGAGGNNACQCKSGWKPKDGNKEGFAPCVRTGGDEHDHDHDDDDDHKGGKHHKGI